MFYVFCALFVAILSISLAALIMCLGSVKALLVIIVLSCIALWVTGEKINKL